MQNNKSKAEAIAITAPDVASTKIAAHRHLSVIDSMTYSGLGSNAGVYVIADGASIE